MKLLLSALAVICCAFSAHAIDPLNGAFGLEFGAVFIPTDANPAGIVRTDEHARMQAYRFQPATPNRHFFEYWVYLTPVTHRVYRIVGVGRANNADIANSLQQAVFTVARERYVGDFSIHVGDMVIQGTRGVSVRPPTPLPDGTALWQVAYTDLALAGRIMAGNSGAYEEVEDIGL